MRFDLSGETQGVWFKFFRAEMNENGEMIYHPPEEDAGEVRIRAMDSDVREGIKKQTSKTVEKIVLNKQTRGMERISYIPDLSPEEAQAEREDMYDYAILGIENFKNSKTGEIIECTRENKICLMKVPVFDRFVARCFQIIGSSGVKGKEEEIKNS